MKGKKIRIRMKEFDNRIIEDQKREIVQNEKSKGENVRGKIKIKKRIEKLKVKRQKKIEKKRREKLEMRKKKSIIDIVEKKKKKVEEMMKIDM